MLDKIKKKKKKLWSCMNPNHAAKMIMENH